VSDVRSTSYLCELIEADREKGVRLHASRFPGPITSKGNARPDIVANDYDRLQVLSSFTPVIDCVGWFSHANKAWGRSCDRNIAASRLRAALERRALRMAGFMALVVRVV
jgi:hypothetical protein